MLLFGGLSETLGGGESWLEGKGAGHPGQALREVAHSLPEKPLSLYPVICRDVNIAKLQAPTASYGAPNTVMDFVPSTEGQSEPLLWVLPS